MQHIQTYSGEYDKQTKSLRRRYRGCTQHLFRYGEIAPMFVIVDQYTSILSKRTRNVIAFKKTSTIISSQIDVVYKLFTVIHTVGYLLPHWEPGLRGLLQ